MRENKKPRGLNLEAFLIGGLPLYMPLYAALSFSQSTSNSLGVALAAIQDLYLENQDLKAQNASLETRLTNLEQNSLPNSFNWINLLGVIAFAGFVFNWIQQRRSKRSQA